jgi:arylsulfatase A-like enzyme
MKFTAAYASPNCAPTRASHFPAYLEANRDGSTWRTTPAAAVRAGRYKLIEFFETGALELYDLEEDISESQNLVSSHSELAAELHKKLEHWQERVDAPMPTVK